MLLLAVHPAAGQAKYTFKDASQPIWTKAYARGVSDSGLVVGYFTTAICGVNSGGTIVGTYVSPNVVGKRIAFMAAPKNWNFGAMKRSEGDKVFRRAWRTFSGLMSSSSAFDRSSGVKYPFTSSDNGDLVTPRRAGLRCAAEC